MWGVYIQSKETTCTSNENLEEKAEIGSATNIIATTLCQ